MFMEQWTQTRRKYRELFLVTFCAGLAAYGFLMTNVLNNQDNISNTPGGYGSGTTSGRWFLEAMANVLKAVWGTNTLPLFNGLLSIALVALAACLTVSLLDLQSRPFIILTGLLYVTFPSLGMTMLFMFTVGYYAFALVLTLVGAYAVKNLPSAWGVPLGTVCLALALGIYQAYLPVAAALFLLILLRRGLSEPSVSPLSLFLHGLRFLAVLVLSLILYMVILRLLLHFGGQSLNSYQQIDQMGAVALHEIPGMIASAYDNFFKLAYQSQYSINATALNRFAFLLSMLLSAVLFVLLEVRSNADWRVKLLNAVFFLLFPAGAFSISILCYHSAIFGRMAYGAVTAFFLPMVLLERVDGKEAARIASAVLSAVLFLTSLNYLWQSNENYMVLYYTNRQTENYFASMVTRIRMTPGYRQDLLLAIVGENVNDQTFANDIYRRSQYHYGGYTDNSNYKKAGQSYMSSYLGFHQPTASAAQIAELADTDAVRAMPCYPDDGSIRVIDSYIVVKLENAVS